MSYYPREEQETHYGYDPISDNWRVDSSYPPHIRKLLEVAKVTHTESDERGRIISVVGVVDGNQIRTFKRRV